MNRSFRATLTVVCVLVITICAAMLAGRLAGNRRLADLTADNLYTLSDGTKNILAKGNQPIALKLYYARTAALKGGEGLRMFNNYFLYVRDLLGEYVRRSGGKLTLEVIDPRPYSDDEQEALRAGIRRFPITEDEGFFFGLIADTKMGKTRVIELFDPDRQALVEYDVSKILSELMTREKQTVGVLSSLPVSTPEVSEMMRRMMQYQQRPVQEPWAIVSHLRQGYEVRNVEVADAEAKIPDDIDYLAVIHPKDLDTQTLFAIDQFVMRGGQLLVFVDPHCLSDAPPPTPYGPSQGKSASSELNALLEKWGVRTDTGEIAVDRALATWADLGRNRPEPLPILLSLTAESGSLNRDEVVTRGLDSIRLLFAGAIHTTDVEGVKVRPLLQTTPIGNVWRPAGPFELQNPDPQRILSATGDGTACQTLACLLTGTFASNFPDGIDLEPNEPAEAKSDEAATQPVVEHKDAIIQSAEGARVLVVADVDMISDMLAYRRGFLGLSQVGGNAPFVLNALDYLAGSDDLIGIRMRGQFVRPFTVVDEIELEAQKATADEVARIEGEIQDYQEQIRALGSSADTEDPTLIRNEAMARRRELQIKMWEAESRMRKVKASQRERIESLGKRLQMTNTILAPALILVIAVILAIGRLVRARHYAAKTN